jgi:hypothetical protein
VRNLNITPGDTVSVDFFAPTTGSLTIQGDTITNSGTLRLNGTNAYVTGGGRVQIEAGGISVRQLVNINNTIRGGGGTSTAGVSGLVNTASGLVDADVAGQTLTAWVERNEGTLQASRSGRPRPRTTAASSSAKSRSSSRSRRSLYAPRGSNLPGTGRGRRHTIPSRRSIRRTVSSLTRTPRVSRSPRPASRSTIGCGSTRSRGA